jgi:hypothetical protein
MFSKKINSTLCVRISLITGVVAILALATGLSRPKTVQDHVMEAMGLKSCQWTTVKQLSKSEVALTMNGQQYTIDYVFVSNRSENFRLFVSTETGELKQIKAPPANTFRGKLRGIENSSVVGCINETGCCAKVTMPSGDVCFLEPVSSVIDDPVFADVHVVYSNRDVNKEAAGKCGNVTNIIETTKKNDLNFPNPAAASAGNIEVARVALEADFEFFSSSRGGSSMRTTLDLMETVVNFSNEQYGRAGIRHAVSDVVIRSTRAMNPWTTSNSDDLLDELQTFYTNGDGVGTIEGDLCHLFTGRSLTNNEGDSIAGIARRRRNSQDELIPVVCIPSAAFSLTSIQRPSVQRISTTFTHELGHNWNLNHCDCDGFIMNSPSAGALTFTSGSVSQLASTRNSLDCLDSIGSGGFGLTGLINNDAWIDEIFIPDPNFSNIRGTNFNATTQRDEQNLDNTGSTGWWFVDSDSNGTVTIDTFGSDFDTQLHVYEFVPGAGFAGLRLVDNDDDSFNPATGSNRQSQVTFGMTAGTCYEIRVGGFRSSNAIGSGSEGNIVLNGTFTIAGDFDADDDVDGDDVDFYIGNLNQSATGNLAQLDLDGDGQVTIADHNFHVTTLVVTSNGITGALLGDVNLDGLVNVLSDAFTLIANLGQSINSRSRGDLNADGFVDILGDAFILVSQLGQSN